MHRRARIRQGVMPGTRYLPSVREVRAELGPKFDLLGAWMGEGSATTYVTRLGIAHVSEQFSIIMRSTIRRKVGDGIGLFLLNKFGDREQGLAQITGLVGKWYGPENFKRAWAQHNEILASRQVAEDKRSEKILEKLVEEGAREVPVDSSLW